MFFKFQEKINKDVVLQAKEAIEKGDIQLIGKLMKKAQNSFDKYLMPQSSELRSPKLHTVLNYKLIQSFIYGGKGVGSQGDGCAQLLAKGKDEQQKIINILHNSDLNVRCYELGIKRNI